MKEIELKLIRELMINSHRSDRDLAKAIGTSQPTVTRTRTKLEKEGIIKEYAIVPDFGKLGFELLAITFVKLKKLLNPEEMDNARKVAKEKLSKATFSFFMLERGMGLGYHGAIISFHENYASYLSLIDWLRQFAFLQINEIDSFIVNLKDKASYLPPTFSLIAKHLTTLKEKAK